MIDPYTTQSRRYPDSFGVRRGGSRKNVHAPVIHRQGVPQRDVEMLGVLQSVDQRVVVAQLEIEPDGAAGKVEIGQQDALPGDQPLDAKRRPEWR